MQSHLKLKLKNPSHCTGIDITDTKVGIDICINTKVVIDLPTTNVKYVNII